LASVQKNKLSAARRSVVSIRRENQIIHSDNKPIMQTEETQAGIEEDQHLESWHDSDFLLFQTSDAKGQSSSQNDGNIDRAATALQDEANTNSRSSSSRNQSSSLTSVTEIPPWMDMCDKPAASSDYRMIYALPPLVKLHNEIVEFAALMSPQPEEIIEREKFLVKVRELIEGTFGKENCVVELFGSQATGLWLPTSDVDVVVQIPEEEEEESTKDSSSKEKGSKSGPKITKDPRSTKKDKTTPPTKDKSEEVIKKKEQQEMENYNIDDVMDNRSPLARLALALKTKWADHLSYLELIENTRIPIVKFTHAPTNLSCDICLNQKNGPLAADLMERFLDAMPPLKPLTFVLKYFIASRGLNEPYSGGVGSFMLQMMIVSFLQHRERDLFNLQQRDQGRNQESSTQMNLGALLLEFFQLYGGGQLNYVTTGISVRNDGFYFPKGLKDRKANFWQPARPFSLAMENPLEIDADVGKPSFRMQNIQKAFEVSYNVLMSHVSDPAVPTESILASILPPTEEMQKRATLLKANRNEKMMNRHGYSHNDGKGDGSQNKPIDMSTATELDGGLKTQRGSRKKQRKT